MQSYRFWYLWMCCTYRCFFFFCLFFSVYVGVWLSLCMSLCCHICCYQGNPVGRLRSAERCTAWRRETCGAQPVAGKKPVRDSSTNPAPTNPTSWSTPGATARWTLSLRRWGQLCFWWSCQCCFLQASKGALPSFFFLFFSNIVSIHKLLSRTKSKPNILRRFLFFFLQG